MRIYERLLDFFMALFALSSLALWGILSVGGSFNVFAILVLVAPLVASYLIMINRHGHIPSAPVETADEHYGNRFVIETIAIFTLLLFIFFSGSNLVTIILLLVAVFLLLRPTAGSPMPITSFSALEKSPFIPGAALVIAVSYTLISHRSDADDALYLFFGLLPLGSAHAGYKPYSNV